MRLVYILLIIISFYSCKARKSEVVKEETKTDINLISKEEEKESAETNINVNKEILVTDNGVIKTTKTTITPIDKDKNAEFVNKKGEKVNLKNAVYTEEEKEEKANKKTKMTIDLKSAAVINNNKTTDKKAAVKQESASKAKVINSKNLFTWHWIFIPVILLGACYVYYRTNPTSKLFSMFNKT